MGDDAGKRDVEEDEAIGRMLKGKDERGEGKKRGRHNQGK